MVKKFGDLTLNEMHEICIFNGPTCRDCPFEAALGECYENALEIDVDDPDKLNKEISFDDEIFEKNESDETPGILYLCNQKGICSDSGMCGNECKHTCNIKHAANFKSIDNGKSFEEIEPEEELYPGKVLKHGKFVKKMTCPECGCEFVSELNHVFTSFVGGDEYYAECPECKASINFNKGE